MKQLVENFMREFWNGIYVFILGLIVLIFTIGFVGLYSKASGAEIVTASKCPVGHTLVITNGGKHICCSPLAVKGEAALCPVLRKLIAPARAEYVTASTYGDARDVKRTGETRLATGARFNKDKMAVAHRTLPFGTWLTLKRGRHIAVVVVNDRGPFVRGRDLDLTYAANHALMCGGLCRVRIERWQAPLPRPKPDDTIAWGEE